MIDGFGKGWERHLKGAFWIQRSREINGESGGLEQAVWWAWLRQDVWARTNANNHTTLVTNPVYRFSLQ